MIKHLNFTTEKKNLYIVWASFRNEKPHIADTVSTTLQIWQQPLKLRNLQQGSRHKDQHHLNGTRYINHWSENES